MLIANVDQAVLHLRALHALGVEDSFDDFGTGRSNLSYLRRLPVDVVKIDRSQVPDVTAPAEDVSITRAIITMARQLRMKALAEGVESEAFSRFLARPWDVEQLRDRLREAFASTDMDDRNRRLGRELQTAKRELDDLNHRLQTLLKAQLERTRHEVDHREALQDVLDAVPVPRLRHRRRRPARIRQRHGPGRSIAAGPTAASPKPGIGRPCS